MITAAGCGHGARQGQRCAIGAGENLHDSVQHSPVPRLVLHPVRHRHGHARRRRPARRVAGDTETLGRSVLILPLAVLAIIDTLCESVFQAVQLPLKIFQTAAILEVRGQAHVHDGS